MAHNIRLRDIFVALAIKRVRNLFTKWPISILFLMLQLMVVMSIKFSPLLCRFLPFIFLHVLFAMVAGRLWYGRKIINLECNMVYGQRGIKNMINKRVMICRVVKWAFCFFFCNFLVKKSKIYELGSCGYKKSKFVFFT